VKFNLRIDFNNIFNRSFWADPTGTALTNAKQLQTRRRNGNAQSGFGYVLTTFDNGVVRPLPRNGILVGRFTF